MRLTDEQIMDIKEYLNRSIKITISSLIPRISKHGLDLIDTIEALQQEIEQLKDENASLRNWNACEEELHNELLESDKRRWELESELEDANNYREGLEAIVDKLRAHVMRMSEILSAAHILLLPKQIEEVSEGAPDYHNPADVEALRKAREALEQTKGFIKGIGCYCNCEGEYASQCQPCFIVEQIDKALVDGGKAIGGKEDV